MFLQVTGKVYNMYTSSYNASKDSCQKLDLHVHYLHGVICKLRAMLLVLQKVQQFKGQDEKYVTLFYCLSCSKT